MPMPQPTRNSVCVVIPIATAQTTTAAATNSMVLRSGRLIGRSGIRRSSSSARLACLTFHRAIGTATNGAVTSHPTITGVVGQPTASMTS